MRRLIEERGMRVPVGIAVWRAIDLNKDLENLPLSEKYILQLQYYIWISTPKIDRTIDFSIGSVKKEFDYD